MFIKVVDVFLSLLLSLQLLLVGRGMQHTPSVETAVVIIYKKTLKLKSCDLIVVGVIGPL